MLNSSCQGKLTYLLENGNRNKNMKTSLKTNAAIMIMDLYISERSRQRSILRRAP